MNKYINKKILIRQMILFFITLAIFSTLFLTLFLTQVDFLSESLLEGIDDSNEQQAYRIELEQTLLSDSQCKKYDGLYICYYDEDGTLINYKGNYYNIIDKVYAIGAEGHYSLSYPTAEYRVYLREINIENARYLKIVKNITDITYYTEKSNKEATSLILIGLPISIVLSLLLSYLFIRPYKLSKQRNNEFSNDLAHEIRTPLAVVKYNIESMLSEPESSVEDVSSKLITALGQINYLNKMSTDLLQLARSYNGGFVVNISKVDIKSVLEDLFDMYTYLSFDQHKQFEYKINAPNLIDTDIEIIKRLCVIALDNAFKFTKEGESIKIDILQETKHLRIIVSDNGFGVHKEDIKKIFRRFYRAEKSKALDVGGTGLGLPIALALVKAIGGNVKCSSSEGNGFKIEYCLDKKKEINNSCK